MDPETNWPTVEKPLYKMAWRAVERYGISFEDARSEVYVAYMKACARFDASRGATFSSFCCFLANCRLQDLIMKRATESSHMPCVELNEETAGYAPEQRSECMEMLDDLSEDAKEIIALLLEIPEDLLGKAMTPKALLRRVKQHLIEKRGKREEAIQKAHQEIAARLRDRSMLLQNFGFADAAEVQGAIADTYWA